METAQIRHSVIAGRMRDITAPAEQLVNMEGVETLPIDWKTPVEQLQAACERVKKSADIPEVAAATADIGLACGSCHKKVGGPYAQSEPPPDPGSTLAARMKRHAWASERLWEGLYVPAGSAWEAGAKALSTDPFDREALKPGGVYARSAADRFTKLASSAASLKTPEEQAKLYASLLATCASCHEAMKVSPY